MLDAIIISDLHLGSSICKRGKLLHFLNTLPRTERLILNGDVLENLSCLLRSADWEILSVIKSLSKITQVIWVKGNHDNDAGEVAKLINAKFVDDYKFESGPTHCLCVHGDKWDTYMKLHPILLRVIDSVYLRSQQWFPRLATFLKHRSKIMSRCCQDVMFGALKMKYDKLCYQVFCGHTHMAEDTFAYKNSGCWTESRCHYITVKDGFAVLTEFGAAPGGSAL